MPPIMEIYFLIKPQKRSPVNKIEFFWRSPFKKIPEYNNILAHISLIGSKITQIVGSFWR